jgi:NAD(P)-dependent dehydrogenase (short-subunit alcohol dehydrogenase family)
MGRTNEGEGVMLVTEFSGQVVLVTGAAGGIGAATSLAFAEAGSIVALADCEETTLQSLASRMEAIGATVSLWTCDVTDEQSVISTVSGVINTHGRLDHVVHAAGVIASCSVEETSMSLWRQVLDVNLTGSFLVAREAVRAMLAARAPGSVTLVSSQAGKRGGRLGAAYSASKFGVIGLMQSLAQEVATNGIRVNAVCPGDVDTPMTTRNAESRAAQLNVSLDAVVTRMIESIPVGRLASPREIAAVLLFLASPAASYITGESINIDGGQLTG